MTAPSAGGRAGEEEIEDENADECRKPCDPCLNRGCCADYWARMEHEGFWGRAAHRWTERGWREITKP